MQTPTPNSLNGFDWFLLLVLAVSTWAAFRRGIVKVLFSLGGLILGIIVAAWEYPVLARVLGSFIASYPVAEVLSFLLIAVAIMLLFGFLAGVVRKTVKAIGLGPFDRLLGAAFGFLRGCLLGVLAMTVVVAFVPDSAWIRGSELAPYFLAGAHTVSSVVPSKFGEQVTAGTRYFVEQNPDLLKAHPVTGSDQ